MSNPVASDMDDERPSSPMLLSRSGTLPDLRNVMTNTWGSSSCDDGTNEAAATAAQYYDDDDSDDDEDSYASILDNDSEEPPWSNSPEEANCHTSSSTTFRRPPLRRRRRCPAPEPPSSMTVEDLLLPKVSDPDAYMLQREMTVTQERWNAITMMPSPIYCIYYLLSAKWVQPNHFGDYYYHDSTTLPTECWPSQPWHQMPAAPPPAVVAVVIAVILHAPCSVVYHFQAPRLTAHERTTHWSRRLDQSMIHAASALVGYATSGSGPYLLVNLAFNAECIYRQCLPAVQPRRNQFRLSLAVALAYLLPTAAQPRLWKTFSQLSVLLALAFVLFTRYPVGGWSHAAFHLVLALTLPLLLETAVSLPDSQTTIAQAYHCQQQQHDAVVWHPHHNSMESAAGAVW